MSGKEINVGLVEIGDAFGGQYYFPYSISILRAYAEKKLASQRPCRFLPTLYKRGDLQDNAARLSGADIVFYSIYVWNFHASLSIALEAKRINPQIINVFGGPNIPESRDKIFSFLKQFSFVDIGSFGEGEIPFLRIIEKCADRDWDAVPSIGWRRRDHSFAYNDFMETVEDINDIPSPYLSGVLDELILQNPEEKWQGRLETNRGCPFSCAFCYWGKKSERKLKQFDLNRVYREIDWLSGKKIEFVFCCDANFGILKRDLEIARKVAENKKKFGYPKAFSVQNTKNSTQRIFELQKILNDEGLQKGVNIALQSLNEETLTYIERKNIDNRTYSELQTLFTKNHIPTFTDLIIGLPGESYESFTTGVSEIIAGGQHNRIQFINLTVLENTLIADPAYQQRHGLKIVEGEFAPHHSSLNEGSEIKERHSLVIGTGTMPEEDWVKARVFSWMVSLLHFDKLLQLPFVILNEVGRVPYKKIFEIFLQKSPRSGVISDIIQAFERQALKIQNGGIEFCESHKWLKITWFPDELAFIEMSAEGKLPDFYDEALNRLVDLAAGCDMLSKKMISQAVLLNRNVMKQPFLRENIMIHCDYNLWELYQAVINGKKVRIREGEYLYNVDRTSQGLDSWDNWCREVIWYGNKRGDYMYPVSSDGTQRQGRQPSNPACARQE